MKRFTALFTALMLLFTAAEGDDLIVCGLTEGRNVGEIVISGEFNFRASVSDRSG